MKRFRLKAVVVLAALLVFANGGSLASGLKDPIPIGLVKSWAYQIQGLEYKGAVEKLARLEVDMVVVEPMATMTGYDDFDAKGMVMGLKASGSTDPRYRKLILAYVDIGQAEEWRRYFKDDWRPPARLRPARLDGKDPASEMVKFIGEIREYARFRNPDFLIVPQNAPYLIEDLLEEALGYLGVIGAIAQEDLSFSGCGDTDWDDPTSGDVVTPRGTCEWCREDIARVLTKYLKAKKPVFTVDYCLKPENIKKAREYSLSRGFIPFVSRTPLDRLP